MKESDSMRRFILLFTILATASLSVFGQTSTQFSHFKTGTPASPTTCRGEQLKVKHVTDDAAMGGVRLIDYSFTNRSSSPCTLKGYARFEALNRAGRLLKHGRAVNREELPSLEKKAPELVTLEPGGTAWFRIHFNAGGAGYEGPRCPESFKVRITAPGARRGRVLREGITMCRRIEISAVMSGVPQ
jgi:hypothetical protein